MMGLASAGIGILLLLTGLNLLILRVPFVRNRRIPDVAILLLLGLASVAAASELHVPLGSAISALPNQTLLTLAASLLIFYGGAELRPAIVKVVWRPILALSTTGVLMSAGILGVILFFTGIGALTLPSALLLGAILAGTDPAVLVSILDEVRIGERPRETLIAESALNDPVSALLATTLLSWVLPRHTAVSAILLATGWQTVGAILVGLFCGLLARKGAHRLVAIPPSVRFLIVFALTYGLATVVFASPFLAVFVSGFVAQPLRSVALQGDKSHRLLPIVLYLTRCYIFLLLGLSSPISTIGVGVLAAATGAALILVFIARPLAVIGALSLGGKGLTQNEAVFVALNRQTGVMPALFASLVVESHAPHAAFITASVTTAIIVTSALMLPLFEPLARLCKVIHVSDLPATD